VGAQLIARQGVANRAPTKGIILEKTFSRGDAENAEKFKKIVPAPSLIGFAAPCRGRSLVLLRVLRVSA